MSFVREEDRRVNKKLGVANESFLYKKCQSTTAGASGNTDSNPEFPETRICLNYWWWRTRSDFPGYCWM
jgi:hypothetical protein